jgi:hypothetical protein
MLRVSWARQSWRRASHLSQWRVEPGAFQARNRFGRWSSSGATPMKSLRIFRAASSCFR